MRNFVAKNMKQSGTGKHKAKFGKHVSRTRAKQLMLRD